MSNLSRACQKKVTPNSWDDLIENVELQISENQKRGNGLRRAVKTFRHLKKSGHPFYDVGLSMKKNDDEKIS